MNKNNQWDVTSIKLCFCAVTVLLFTGCAATTIPVNYSAQNFVRYAGKAEIGNFTYAPSEVYVSVGTGTTVISNSRRAEPSRKLATKVAPNQLQNTAIDNVYIGVNVADLVKRATALELEKTGFVIGDSNIQVSGDVLEFKANDLGYNVDWTYSIRYKLTDKSSGLELFSKIYIAEPKKTGKFGMASDYTPSINEMILSAYDKFITDDQVKKIFTQNR